MGKDVHNWQRIHNEEASVQNWVYGLAIDGKIKCLSDGSIEIIATGEIGKVGDYLVLLDDRVTPKIIEKNEFEANYNPVTNN